MPEMREPTTANKPNSEVMPTADHFHEKLHQLYNEYMVPVSPQLHETFHNMLVPHIQQSGNNKSTPARGGKNEGLGFGSGLVDFAKSLPQAASDDWNTIHNSVKDMAKGMYPTLDTQLDKFTTRTLVEPYRQMAKLTIGDHVSPDFMNEPRWMRALQGQLDEKTGRAAPLSLEGWKKMLMTDPQYGFQHTEHAKQMTSQAMANLHSAFSGRQ